MKANGFELLVSNLLERCQTGNLVILTPDGRKKIFGGLSSFPKAQIIIKSSNFWNRCVFAGAIGFAESFIEGEWETPDLTSTIAFFILNSAELDVFRKPKQQKLTLLGIRQIADNLFLKLRKNTPKMARRNIEEHYDLGNDFFRHWLDPSMTYSCAFFDPPTLSLHEAQLRKYDRLCQKLLLTPKDHILEIGCGWGGFALYAAKKYGCKVTAITISPSQLNEARSRAQQEGLSNRVFFELRDYRDERGIYDKIISIEMIEAVGDEFLEDYFETCSRCLKKNGLLALQMIVCPDRQYQILRSGADFIQKHIFPGSLLVAQHRITKAIMQTSDFNLLDWEDLGPHYAETLRRWAENFNTAETEIRKLGFSEKFIRKWKYYLAYCEAAFSMRHISVVQALYSRPNNLSLGFGPHKKFTLN
ncbi:MAG: cyclopropane-fatty-acyl-phospholipid synthase family protein [Chthoniobacterales bacterium]|nr:cyclopropane-fatty-acyl-phospholipid synthase family protein [Chthoniobacterales bacterium]